MFNLNLFLSWIMLTHINKILFSIFSELACKLPRLLCITNGENRNNSQIILGILLKSVSNGIANLEVTVIGRLKKSKSKFEGRKSFSSTILKPRILKNPGLIFRL